MTLRDLLIAEAARRVYDPTPLGSLSHASTLAQAAERIQKLEAALEPIANFGPDITHHWADHVRQVARNALKGD